MATKTIRSIKGRRMRLTRLDECGAPDMTSECASIVTSGFISVTLSNEVEEGEEYTQKNAWGDFCIAEKDGDRVKWVNVGIQLCEVDPQVLDLVGGASPVVDDQGNTIGATFGREPNPNSFAIEVWTKKAGSDACSTTGNPEWGYFLVPYVRNGMLDGDITIENGPLTLGLKGEGAGASAAWGTGPYGDNPIKNTTGMPEGELEAIVVTDVQPPEPTDGCQPIGELPNGVLPPVLTSLDPASRVVGPTDDVILRVLGSGFTPGSKIRFGTVVEDQTVFVSPTEVTLEITGSMFLDPDPAVPVTVLNGAAESGPLYFAFTEA